MKRTARILTSLVLVLTLLAPAYAGLFDDLWEIVGVVNYIQTNHFTVLNDKNVVTRVMLKPGSQMPPEIVVGARIRVVASRDSVGNFILEEFEASP